MAKTPKTKKDFDIGKTLPSANKSYQPAKPHQPTDLPQSITEPKGRSWKKLLVRTMLAILAIFILFATIIGVWDAHNFSGAANKMFGSGNLLQLLSTDNLKTDSKGRVNILLAGYSVDDTGHSGATLTDSIMILSLNKANKTGYMLSIPRDLYVNIPGNGYGKINEAYQDGQSENFSESGYADGGMGLLEKIVYQDFNISASYYSIIDYAAVRDTVNALGGINLNIQSPDPRGLYDPNINIQDGGPLKLPNGWQTINGQTALNLVRARGDSPYSYGFPQSDFNRTEHQRQVLVAIKNKLNWKLVLNPRKNGKIFNAVGDNVKTDLTLSDLRPLFGLFNSVPSNKLQSISLNNFNGKNLLRSYITQSGQDALVPAAGLNDYSQIQAVISQL